MQQPSSPTLYRRIPPFFWNAKRNKPKERAFLLRENEEGLSLYRADMRSPRSVIQGYIDDQYSRLSSPDETERAKAQRMLDQHGNTVELAVQAGWHIARLAITEFTDRGFSVEEPNEKGHVNVRGSRADFETYSVEWVEAEVLATEETLSDNVES